MELAGNQTLTVMAEMLNEIVAKAVTAVSQTAPARRTRCGPVGGGPARRNGSWS